MDNNIMSFSEFCHYNESIDNNLTVDDVLYEAALYNPEIMDMIIAKEQYDAISEQLMNIDEVNTSINFGDLFNYKVTDYFGRQGLGTQTSIGGNLSELLPSWQSVLGVAVGALALYKLYQIYKKNCLENKQIEAEDKLIAAKELERQIENRINQAQDSNNKSELLKLEILNKQVKADIERLLSKNAKLTRQMYS